MTMPFNQEFRCPGSERGTCPAQPAAAAVASSHERHSVVVTLPSEIDLTNASEVQDALARALESGTAVVVADAAETTFCDCAGVRALMCAHRRATAAGTELRVASPTSPEVRRILGLTGAGEVLDTYPTLTAARDGPGRATGARSRPAEALASPTLRDHAVGADSGGGNGPMADARSCEQCGAEFVPRREHARFCSALCRITWNRRHANGRPTGDTPLNWSVSALEDTANRLREARTVNLPEALAAISEAVWWVTLVDATMVRYHHDAYDRALGDLQPAERRLTEGTFTGLRFVRNCMGHYVDPADFIQPQQDSAGGDAPVAAWTWRHVPAPATSVLRQRSTWENSRYLHYRAFLAERPVGETINRTAGFLIQLGGRLPALMDCTPCPGDSGTLGQSWP
jgi:anti-anti-sigma factor